MKQRTQEILADRAKTIPILSFPSTQLLGITVRELISDSENQARGMEAIVKRCPVAASLSMMDLSVEAEAFGAEITISEHENPTVRHGILESEADIAAMQVPEVGAGRTGIYVEGVRLAKARMPGTPVFCGVIGPYSLAGRLFDMGKLMLACYDEPEQIHALLQKCADFSIRYIKAFQTAGADGVILAEPAAGLLSPDLCEEFSSAYVKQIRAETAAEDFVFVYHNCGNTIPLAESLLGMDADIYHLGNAIELDKILPLFPEDKPVMGNLNPLLFRTATPAEIQREVLGILARCSPYPRFRLSTGCDIPADANWENLDAYFQTLRGFYKKESEDF